VTGYPKTLAEGWFPIAGISELRGRPLVRRLMGRPLIVFQSNRGPAVLDDRCPHRNLALSQGRVRGGEIECAYHGWRFDGAGRCTLTPGAEQPAPHAAQSRPAVLRTGLIWTTLADPPASFPEPPFPLDADGFDTFLWPVKPSRARWLDAVENFLDPAHPHFLHAGIVRSGDTRHPVDVTVRVSGAHAEAIYVENTRTSALIPRLLEGLRTNSIGRYFPPVTGQIAFEGPSGPRLIITVFFIPEDHDRVRPYAHFATPKGRAPAWLKQSLLRLLNAPVLLQDRAVLRAQADNIERFGGPRYGLGPLDFLLPAIQRLAAGERPEPSEHQVRVRL
jgi:phenylpropionate dioxygenase-like ring-hydroxylating dioxygenase large terminal subunit